MGNAHAGAWRYTARYGLNWRSARAVSAALGSLALPMPPWLRMVVARCLTRRTALHADAQGIWGSAGRLPAGSADPCPWQDVTEIVVWNHDHLRIIGLAHRGEVVGSGPAARAVAPTPQQSRPARRRTFRRHPTYPAFIAPDGSPYDIANVLTTNGWCVDIPRLQATVRHFAPRARFVDLSKVTAPESVGPVEYAVEILAGLIELIGWRRLGWLLGVAASAAVLAVAAANLGTQSHAPVGVTAGKAGVPARAGLPMPSGEDAEAPLTFIAELRGRQIAEVVRDNRRRIPGQNALSRRARAPVRSGRAWGRSWSRPGGSSPPAWRGRRLAGWCRVPCRA
jgi:hypothetical protein